MRLAGVALSVAVALGIAELGVRLLASKRMPPRSTEVEYRQTSRAGRPDFRNRPVPGPKEPETFRILVVGDSFAWGGKVHSEDAFPDRLQIRLNALPPEQPIEVVNWSRPGWNTVQQYRSVRKRLDRLDPDLLIIAFVLNDAEPNSKSLRERLREPANRRAPAPGVSEWLHRTSALYRLLWERIENTRQHRASRAYYNGFFAGSGWKNCRRVLRLFKRGADRLEIPFLLAVFPVFDSPIDESYPYHEAHQAVAGAAAELNIHHLDLRAAYLGVEARRLAVEPFTDGHPSELAHRLAADYLLDFLVASEWLPVTIEAGN